MSDKIEDICTCLNIKESHFNNGWANFDALNYYHLARVCGYGCSLVEHPNTHKTINIIFEFPELMCFGKISEECDIVLLGITGFPSNETCVKYLKDISESAKKRKITSNYVFIEW